MEIRNTKKESVTISYDILDELVVAGYYDDESCEDYVLELNKGKVIDLLKKMLNAKEIMLR